MKVVEWLECMGTIQVLIDFISINSFEPPSKLYDIDITMIYFFTLLMNSGGLEV